MDVALKTRLFKVVGFVSRRYTWPCFLRNTIRSYSLKTQDRMATADVLSLLSNPRPVVGVCQMTSTSDKDKNFMKAKSLLERCKALGAKMVFFPEACDYIADNKQQSMTMAECLSGEIMTKYMQLAKEKSVWISVGGFHQKSNDPELKKLYNTHVIIDDQGEIKSTYSKAHMFDLDIQGKIRLCESDYTIPGDRIVPPVQTPVGKIGLAICYDVRFPELSIALRNLGAEILTFPSAFTVPTGMAHWHVLLRNRAIETQSYVIAAAQTGRHNDSRASYGHSMIVDPWGTIVAECPDGESVCVAEIDLDYLTKVRTQMPVQHHKRLDLYGEINLSMRDCDIDKQAQYDFGAIQVGSQQVFYKTSLSYAFVNIKPIVPGHVLVASLRNVTRFYELEPCEVSDLFNTVQVVSKVIEKHFKGTSVTISIQDGPEAGQTVKHVHVHIIPRIHGDFPQNDSIYMKLQNHDKNLEEERQQGNLRTVDQMNKEAAELRTFFA